MATINFLYRSNKPEAKLTLRLLFRFEGIDFVFAGNTKIEVSKEYMSKYHKSQRISDINILNIKNEVSTKINDISNYILKEFDKCNPKHIDKEWLKLSINAFYNPKNESNKIPSELYKYFEHYINSNKQLKIGSIKKLKVIAGYVKRYEAGFREPLLIKNIDLKFKLDFENYMLSQHYDINTISVAFKNIRTMCNDARRNGLETSYQLADVKSKYIAPDDIYLAEAEIVKIKGLKLSDKLDDVRDWLLIACYSAQRISDFMRFDNNMITIYDGTYVLEFSQEKTEVNMAIPLSPEFIEVLNKRNFQFPKSMLHQEFNKLVKEVCFKAGLVEIVEGSKKVENRQVKGNYPKFELVSAHIGRRTFATLFYQKYTISELTYITGHASEKAFLVYMKKGNIEIAKSIAEKYYK